MNVHFNAVFKIKVRNAQESRKVKDHEWPQQEDIIGMRESEMYKGEADRGYIHRARRRK